MVIPLDPDLPAHGSEMAPLPGFPCRTLRDPDGHPQDDTTRHPQDDTRTPSGTLRAPQVSPW